MTEYTFATTILIALSSVGSSMVLASAGFYMQKRGFILGKQSKMTLALLSKYVTLPLLYFSSLVRCTPDSTDPNKCFTVTEQLSGGLWLIFIWPVVVVV